MQPQWAYFDLSGPARLLSVAMFSLSRVTINLMARPEIAHAS